MNNTPTLETNDTGFILIEDVYPSEVGEYLRGYVVTGILYRAYYDRHVGTLTIITTGGF